LRAAALLPTLQIGFSRSLREANEVIVEVKGGEGGDDSKLFAHDLFAALTRYAKRHGVKVEPLSSADGHLIGKFNGPNVWQLLEPQIGKHCVQRVPPTENRGRRHTSYLCVAVLPMLQSNFQPLERSEIRIKTQGGHGAGGQHQNKRDSAVRVTHIPTGISVFINGRSQHANRHEAIRVLTARVRDSEQQTANASYRELRKSQFGNSGRGGTKIRTYNYLKDRAVDHRTGAKVNVRKVIDKGEFELLN